MSNQPERRPRPEPTDRRRASNDTAAADEVRYLEHEIIDAVAALESLLLAWRDHDPAERDTAEVDAILEAVVQRLRGALAHTDEGRDEVQYRLEQLQDEFERGA